MRAVRFALDVASRAAPFTLPDAERAASGDYAAPRGDLVITAPVVFGRLHVLPIINDFLTKYPDINVRLVLADRNLHLIDDHIDMAVRIGELSDSALAYSSAFTVSGELMMTLLSLSTV